MPAQYPPPLQVGTASPPSLCTAQTASRMPQRDIAYPPYRALPPPSPYRMGRRGPQPVSRSRLLGRRLAHVPLGGAERPGTGPPPLARPSKPRAAPLPPAHGRVPRGRRLRSPRPGGAGPPPPQSGGHPHGMLPPLDGHGRGPQVGAVDPTARPPGPGSVGPRAPRGPRLAVWPGSYALAVPPPPLEGGRVALPGRPPAGAPLGPLPVRRARAAAPQAWTSAPQRRVLLVEGWDDEAEGSVGHWVGITHGGTIRCLLRGNRPLAPPRDPLAAAGAVLASIPRVFAVWYAMMPAPEAPQPPSQHRDPPRGGRRPRSGVARGPRARGGVATAP